jgi:hypothetical protein
MAIHLRKPQRQLDIFFKGHAGQQIKRLKHHPDCFSAISCELFGIQFRQIAILDANCARRGAIKASQQIQECRLAGPGAAQQGEELAPSNREGYSTDGRNDRFAQSILAGDAFGF